MIISELVSAARWLSRHPRWLAALAALDVALFTLTGLRIAGVL